MKLPLLTATWLVLAEMSLAQVPCATPGVTATASPAVAQLGQPIAVTVTNNSNVTINLPSSCVYSLVFPGGSCTGVPAFGPLCLAVIVPIPPGGSMTMPWAQNDGLGNQVPAGPYSFEINYFDAAGTLVSCCVSATIASSVGTAYCFDDSGCPCANSDPFAGCANSTSTGALLTGTGSASLLADDLLLTVSNVPAGTNGLVYRGGAANRLAFGDGLRCVAAGSTALCRFPIQNSGISGTLTEGPGIVASSLMQGGACAIAVGQTWYFQGWYRDAAGPCGTGFNLSSGYEVTFGP